MSDDEFMMDDAIEEDYGFEYEDDDEDMDADADTENKYYNAKSIKDENPDEALKDLQGILDAETQLSEWGFKALKQQTKIHFHRGHHAAALETYRTLLPYTKSAVTRNYAEKTINSVLDYVSATPQVTLEIVEAFYNATEQALAASQSDRLNVKIKLKLARLWLQRHEWPRLIQTLKGLRAEEFAMDKGDGQSKGTMMLELLALEIQMYHETGNIKMVKETKYVIDALTTENWEAAQVNFFQAFRNYDEAGSPQRIQVLKYLVLAHMLMGSEVNPFDSQETKPYRDDPNIMAMTALVDAYQRRDIQGAERIVAENHDTLTDDAFINEFISDVIKELRIQYLIDVVRPYGSIRLSSLSEHLHIPLDQVESFVLMLILDGRIEGKMDEVAHTLTLGSPSVTLHEKEQKTLCAWSEQLVHLAAAISTKRSTFRLDHSPQQTAHFISRLD
ncbi:hypothetical protein MVES1_002063 [Malassezia vespertilionis]|uniref:uncharacterized protein n=1 Tax=Malassezia vespertilionis TaxID=2020962 RepID=UPI0024B1C252|nr:uncharacterized protein MVES1_002063 [Malassezia vespertilionis]WFD06709.1 hypothetical protein MVES1_002063 [Malassezia vespertilionis]